MRKNDREREREREAWKVNIFGQVCNFQEVFFVFVYDDYYLSGEI